MTLTQTALLLLRVTLTDAFFGPAGCCRQQSGFVTQSAAERVELTTVLALAMTTTMKEAAMIGIHWGVVLLTVTLVRMADWMARAHVGHVASRRCL